MRTTGKISSKRSPKVGGKSSNTSRDIEQKYRALFEKSPYGILLIDTEGKILDFNETAHCDLGYTREEFVNITIADIDPVESAVDVKARISRILEKGSAEFETRHRTKQGEIRDVHVITKALTLSGQTVCHSIWRDITERKKAESALELFKKLLNKSSEAIFVSDPQTGRFLDVNDRACASLGYDREELLRLGVMDIETNFPDNFSWEGHVSEVRQKGSLLLEGIHRRKDGTTFPSEANVSFVSLNGREYMIAVVRDITERMRVEERLRDTNTRLETLIQAIPDMVILKDALGRYKVVNRAVEESIGRKQEELIGKTNNELLPPDIAEMCNKTDAEAIRRSRPTHADEQYFDKDGRVKFFDTIKVPIHDRKGRLTGLLCVARDITERKKAEEALQRSEDRFRTLFESTTDGLFIIDTEGYLIDVNKTAYERLGFTKEEMLSMHISSLDHPDYREKIPERMEHLQKYGWCVCESAHLRKDGTVMPVEINARIMDYAEKKVFFSVIRDITERKKSEETIRKFADVFQHIRIGISIGTVESSSLGIMNPAFAEMHGYTIEELEGRPIADVYAPEARAELPEYIRITNEKGYHAYESLHVRKDGSVFPVQVEVYAIKNKEGRVLYRVANIQDITGRKKAEETLRQSEERFRLAMLGATDGLWDWNLKTDEVYYSPRWKSMLGYFEEELEHHLDTWKRLVHPDDRERTLAAVSDLLEGRNDKFEVEFRMHHKGGHYLSILSRAFLAHGADGSVSRLVGTHVDITQRKRAEEKIQQSEEFVRSILDSVDEGFIVIDRDYLILTANKAYCAQTARPCDNIIGKHCYEIAHGTDRPCNEMGEECAVRQVFETGEPHATLHKHSDAKGSILYVETKAFPIKDSTGIVISVIETVNNISEKHLLEEERLKTQKLEAIGTLAGGIAHDFNNLLQGVFGYISMAKRMHDQKQKSLDMLEQAEKALHMSVNLTSQLLTFSKGGKPLTQRIALRPIIENSVKFALSGSRIDYRIQVEEGLGMVEADEGQIGQVIQNLVLNAEQAMPMGGIINITARNDSSLQKGLPPVLKQGNYVEISIKDTGIGIPEQYLPKIFDPYFTTKDNGSGLGLATSYSIIKNHGGVIDVKSKLGEGTAFFVYLPAVEAVETSAVTVSEDVRTLKKGRILLMDDEDIIRDIAGLMIRSLGHEVELAENGNEAIEKYCESMKTGRQFDIVIMDLTVRGGMGGEEAIEELLKIDPDIKAIVSSGYTDSSAISEYKTIGFRACLTKPYDIDSLNAALNGLPD